MSGFIFDKMLQWIYLSVYSAVAEFFKLMGNMGADMFGLEWVKATVKLFGLFGWSLFAAGTVVAVFDTAIEYQCGKANIKTTALTNFFLTDIEANISLFNTLSLVAFAYCIIKVFFANIKLGGI